MKGMKKLSVIILLSLVSLYLSAQSSVSNPLFFTREDVTIAFIPPCLDVEFEYQDSNGNRILEAGEDAQIVVTVSNTGGKATNVDATLGFKSVNPGIDITTKTIRINTIETNSKAIVSFPIKAAIDIPTISGEDLVLEVGVKEPFGYDTGAIVHLSTYELQKADLQVQGVEIVDAGRNVMAKGTPDNQIQRGETVLVTVFLQNVGHGVADDLEYTIQSSDKNVHILGETGYISEFSGSRLGVASGETIEIPFRLSVNNNYYSDSKYLPVTIAAKEKYGFGNVISNIHIPFDATPEEIKVAQVVPDYDKLIELGNKTVIIKSENNNKSRSVNIDVAPKYKPSHSDAIAVVIGAEKNKYGAAPALYAADDARRMSGYFKNCLGIEKVITLQNEEVTRVQLDDIFDSDYGDLARSVEKGKTDVFVYYSGHGMPDLDTNGSPDIFLFPYDAMNQKITERGYSISKLYANLDKLGAKSVTVILDACFSGSSKSSSLHESQQIGNTKGASILVEPQAEPWNTNPNFRVFTSSSYNQTSLSDDESESGLFTYYLAAGIQGEADSDSDGVISMSELVEYVSTNVSEAARKQRKMDQNPQFYGNGNFIVSYTR